ncbi:MAG: restriction endonuclease subunit [Chitinophagaceae bacterium]|nr:restriction endonuclease subunit [Chitinophagaceae bacterium]
MIKIDYPKQDFKIKAEAGKELIFDDNRKAWVRLTPEEWVRQNFIQYLLQSKKYPSSLISIEKEIELNGLKKRYDIIVYKSAAPWMMIECKEMNVELSDNVIQQLLRYHMVIPVPYLVITNGSRTMAWEKKNNELVEMNALPEW